MVIVTPSAAAQIREILSDEPYGAYVRAYISGGGCSGFNYGFTIEESMEEDDLAIDELLVDPISLQYFDGSTIDFTNDKLQGSKFIISNPKATSTCGCGSSFAV
tara:strand:+ start:317 stop:628 length:312 start_codon:yes stop_codon:yes gene_type:complete